MPGRFAPYLNEIADADGGALDVRHLAQCFCRLISGRQKIIRLIRSKELDRHACSLELFSFLARLGGQLFMVSGCCA